MLDVTLKQHIPFAQYQILDVTFGDAHVDYEIEHTLQPPTPEHVDYFVIRQAQSANIYHDMSGERLAWQEGLIRLRSSVANARVTLLLMVSHDKRDLPASGPTTVVPATSAHVHDAADITTGTLDDARIPALAASKITSGTFDVARVPDLDAAKLTTGTLDVARIPSLDAAKITTGALAKARQHAQTAYLDTAQTFSAKQTLSVAPELTLGATERGRTAPIGTYTQVTFDATDFTVNTGGPWTVSSAQVATFQWRIIGTSMLVNFYITGGTLTGATTTELLIAIPDGYVANKTKLGTVRITNNATDSLSVCVVSAGQTNIRIFTDATFGGLWTGGTVAVQGEIEFEVQT